MTFGLAKDLLAAHRVSATAKSQGGDMFPVGHRRPILDDFRPGEADMARLRADNVCRVAIRKCRKEGFDKSSPPLAVTVHKEKRTEIKPQA